MPELREQKVLYVISEGREVRLMNEGVLKDTIGAYGVHIYSTKALADSQIWSEASGGK